jgi:dihydrodipicolinate synthase/N-acetylneuraminate lyase
MGVLAHDAVRAPLLPLDEAPRARLAQLLRGLGLVESPGGRIATPAPEAAA